jgi:aryl-phospho-beta-D-glucosidase BglC (GH1 family)
LPPGVSGGHSLEPNALSIAVSGNHLVNGNGEVVTLHGVNISSTEWQCLYGQAFESPSNEASIAAMAAWHINAVRIPLNEDCWLGINGAPTAIAAYHEVMLNYVRRLNAHGIYAILDLHWVAPGATLSHDGPSFDGFYEMADESHSPTFWRSIAGYFSSDPAVIFDLYNEPFGISWQCWREGCIAPRGYQTAGMQQLIDAVREVGATQPVMVGGLEKAGLLGTEWLANRPTDPAGQLVASAHVYNTPSSYHFNTQFGTVASRLPVVIGETGEMDCTDTDLDAFLPWAQEHGVSYLAWAWYTGECSTYPALISNYNGTPTAYGIGYREYLMAHFPAP